MDDDDLEELFDRQLPDDEDFTDQICSNEMERALFCDAPSTTVIIPFKPKDRQS